MKNDEDQNKSSASSDLPIFISLILAVVTLTAISIAASIVAYMKEGLESLPIIMLLMVFFISNLVLWAVWGTLGIYKRNITDLIGQITNYLLKFQANHRQESSTQKSYIIDNGPVLEDLLNPIYTKSILTIDSKAFKTLTIDEILETMKNNYTDIIAYISPDNEALGVITKSFIDSYTNRMKAENTSITTAGLKKDTITTITSKYSNLKTELDNSFVVFHKKDNLNYILSNGLVSNMTKGVFATDTGGINAQIIGWIPINTLFSARMWNFVSRTINKTP